MEHKQLLEIRNRLKRKKPTFLRQDAHKIKSIAQNWRAPQGKHSSIRRKRRGHRRQPSIGWSSPKGTKHLTQEGYKVIVVHNVRELDGMKEPVTIGRQVGTKKKVEIVKKAKELKLPIINVKDPDAFIKKVEEDIASRKKAKKVKEETKKKREEESVKKAKEKEEKEKAKTDEEKEKEVREEKRKVLEKR